MWYIYGSSDQTKLERSYSTFLGVISDIGGIQGPLMLVIGLMYVLYVEYHYEKDFISEVILNDTKEESQSMPPKYRQHDMSKIAYKNNWFYNFFCVRCCRKKPPTLLEQEQYDILDSCQRILSRMLEVKKIVRSLQKLEIIESLIMHQRHNIQMPLVSIELERRAKEEENIQTKMLETVQKNKIEFKDPDEKSSTLLKLKSNKILSKNTIVGKRNSQKKTQNNDYELKKENEKEEKQENNLDLSKDPMNIDKNLFQGIKIPDESKITDNEESLSKRNNREMTTMSENKSLKTDRKFNELETNKNITTNTEDKDNEFNNLTDKIRKILLENTQSKYKKIQDAIKECEEGATDQNKTSFERMIDKYFLDHLPQDFQTKKNNISFQNKNVSLPLQFAKKNLEQEEAPKKKDFLRDVDLEKTPKKNDFTEDEDKGNSISKSSHVNLDSSIINRRKKFNIIKKHKQGFNKLPKTLNITTEQNTPGKIQN